MATVPIPTVSANPTNLFASIDMGTNSFKLLTVQFNPSTGKFLHLHRLKEPVVLGRQAASAAAAVDSQLRAIEALKEFRNFLQNHEIHRHRTVATAAVREAGNQAEFLRRVRDEVGFEVEVLSGEEEARLIYLGALQFLPIYEKTALVIDIGGGSTEFLLGQKGKAIFGTSVKLGHVNLTQKFVNHNEILQMRSHIRSILRQCGIVEKIKHHGFEIAVGSSGTVQSIEKAIFSGFSRNVVSNDGALCGDLGRDWRFSREELRILVERLCGGGGEAIERARRDRFFKRRSEFIVAGAVLLDEIFAMLDIEEMEVSGYALGEGVVAEMLLQVCDNYDFNANARWGSVVRLATRFLGKKKMGTASQCANITKVIFEGLRKCDTLAETENQVKLPVSLNDKDLEYLEAACVLHNIGLITGEKGYHKQSCNIIMNGDHLYGYSTEEVKLIALLARHHRKKFPKPNHGSLKEFSKEVKEKFKMLCAIIRVSIAVQKHRGLNIQGMEFSRSSEGFKLIVSETKDQSLLPGIVQPLAEGDEAELRKELGHFEMVFQEKLSIAVPSSSSESSERSRHLQWMH
ncbi:hypothetical protein VitviT2T_020865 [Vitis vinifera]|uniref:Ppx/GppA phosphatase domain-containing protein n=2 Tax=Vitis vinifera TaxID=29760 RepID=A0ABY9D5C5_VITVI|eukprot:XP_002278296.1 PREDICTED: uncharacterized protein LOC100249506 [Vitis vinifera]